MKTFRLEELLRLGIISAVAVVVGIVALLISTSRQPGTAVDASDLLAITFLAIAIFVIAFPSAVVAGLVLHLVLRLRVWPRILLLPIFISVAFLVGSLVSDRRWVGFLPLTLSIAFTAWLLYSFGPMRLWRFEFVPGEHSDF